ncbi:hypothetical protein R50345_05845 [Paenibacillus sp. FSL R5-0345]|uniref:stalk domain-containing protein n=1 Tax=Paenibacillus sp. FSL R5-0345 TaxID=1536770 RepID=UPI0004F817CB|nr:hypothetical protein [Paenibacillus sp. FSL R5-0345]AIQ34195.1 hypothetical protein R50345_05845 [Paenibacillus sp. FSL R5-0345]
MKKKIIAIAVTASLLMTGVVSAASMWGTYKGNDIIRITSNGVALKTNDVPAISYNGRTMIPINMLGQIGLGYNWDQDNKTVDVKSPVVVNEPAQSTTTQNMGISTLASQLKGDYISSIVYSSNGTSSILIYNYSKSFTDLDNNINALFLSSTKTDVDTLTIKTIDKYELTIYVKDAREFYDGKTTVEQFAKKYKIITPTQTSNTQNTTTNTQTNIQTNIQPSQTTQKSDGCQVLRNSQAEELASYERNNAPTAWDGSAGYQKEQLINNQQKSLAAAGCN